MDRDYTIRHLHVVERLIYVSGGCPCCDTSFRRRIVDFRAPLETPLSKLRWPWRWRDGSAPHDHWMPVWQHKRARKGSLGQVLKDGYTRLEAWCGDLKCHHKAILKIADLPLAHSTTLDDLEVRLRCSKCLGIDIGVAPDSLSRPDGKPMKIDTWGSGSASYNRD